VRTKKWLHEEKIKCKFYWGTYWYNELFCEGYYFKQKEKGEKKSIVNELFQTNGKKSIVNWTQKYTPLRFYNPTSSHQCSGVQNISYKYTKIPLSRSWMDFEKTSRYLGVRDIQNSL
jgi:hypothetical protein